MLKNTFIENSKVSCATTNIDDCDTCFKIFLSHNRGGRSKRLQYQVFCIQASLLNAAIDIADCIFVSCDDMKIRTELHATIPDRASDILKIIDGELLRDHIYDLVARRDVSLVLISYQLINFGLRDLFLCVMPHNVSARLQTFYVMARDPYINLVHIQVGIGRITVFKRRLYRFN